jgi:hypothetical protein
MGEALPNFEVGLWRLALGLGLNFNFAIKIATKTPLHEGNDAT